MYSVDDFTAGDSHGETAAVQSPTTGFPKYSHSFFNKAFRDALKAKGKNIQEVYHLVLTSELMN